MDNMTLIAMASIVTAGITTGIGCMAPALGEGRSVATALTALAQQPDASATITRTLFVGGLDDSHFRQSLLEPGHQSGRKVNPC